jgi:transcriptional regulator of acetoin/glycerol metabolism
MRHRHQEEDSVRYGSLPDAALIRRAHHLFLDTGKVPDGVVPEVIRRSWVRCAQSGLQSDRLREIGRVDESDLRESLERYGELIGAAEPVMDILHQQIQGTGCIVLLCAPDGLILHSLGDPEFLPRAERVALRPGVPWTEDSKGTNAVGTAIVEREPVVVFAAEHYIERNHFLTCSGTPVFDPCGELAAVLDITGDYRSHQPHTMALVRMAGRNIERQLFLRKHQQDLLLQVHRNQTYLGSLFDGRVAFSEGGQLLAAEATARENLGLSGPRLAARFEELFDTSFAVVLSRLRSQDSVAQLRLRSGGEIVYAQLARGLPRPVSAAVPSPARSHLDPASVTAGTDRDSPRTSPETRSTPCERLAEIEMQAIRNAIAVNSGNISAAAKQLGISRATLYRKLKPQHPQA